MDPDSAKPSSQQPANAAAAESPTPAVATQDRSTHDSPPLLSASGISSWAKNLKIPQPLAATQDDSQTGDGGKSTFSRFTSGFGLRLSPAAPMPAESVVSTSTTTQPGVLESFTKGLVDSSKSAVKAVQEGEFDLDMTYITENIIAMGFPAGDMSSGFLGFIEGFYRNHMEEVIKFFETHHKGKYKVYNLCSERLYDASLFEGKVASFPFDDHNCPPIQLITSFCQSAYSWLKQDIENVVVVHCKAGMARTGLMISSLLLFLKFFPTAEESINYYNQKRCLDGKGLVLPSQIRYVKYFERILTHFNGQNPPGRRCMLRGFRLHRCPSWFRPSITVSDHNAHLPSQPEDFWISAAKKGIVVFALPREPGLAELAGDFKFHFHDSEGDFYWISVFSGGYRRKLPSPGFQVEVVMIDYDGTIQTRFKSDSSRNGSDGNSGYVPAPSGGVAATSNQSKVSESQDNDDVFSDSEGEETESSTRKQAQTTSGTGHGAPGPKSGSTVEQIAGIKHGTEHLSLVSEQPSQINPSKEPKSDGALQEVSDFKAIAADASVFSFGDEEDYESE
ncbi:Phosphatidylinositol 3,4,5-trisphosphate 3-phosphatase and protein-tyrosine-phosphatase PTEN2A [Vitis vinifera]|uniref:Phosphatidylinositol 3,4,5-trisphosphate 3-phosphatase and protein-tyrosine-phosphatase PTEN2A n=1 Tax=Vitis vinifera TaxID=29760 RepID=A0A438KRU6_VITVI|nr:Phosphatidylinositol 3,4,5-trisphosphate 3-phosphatase and protein-tyrosine-phosphatase PTEN2A [Vitis vinifera]